MINARIELRLESEIDTEGFPQNYKVWNTYLVNVDGSIITRMGVSFRQCESFKACEYLTSLFNGLMPVSCLIRF